jgi:hypothetical protein
MLTHRWGSSPTGSPATQAPPGDGGACRRCPRRPDGSLLRRAGPSRAVQTESGTLSAYPLRLTPCGQGHFNRAVPRAPTEPRGAGDPRGSAAASHRRSAASAVQRMRRCGARVRLRKPPSLAVQPNDTPASDPRQRSPRASRGSDSRCPSGPAAGPASVPDRPARGGRRVTAYPTSTVCLTTRPARRRPRRRSTRPTWATCGQGRSWSPHSPRGRAPPAIRERERAVASPTGRAARWAPYARRSATPRRGLPVPGAPVPSAPLARHRGNVRLALGQEGRLILFDGHQVGAFGSHHVLAHLPLSGQGVSGQHPSDAGPVSARMLSGGQLMPVAPAGDLRHDRVRLVGRRRDQVRSWHPRGTSVGRPAQRLAIHRERLMGPHPRPSQPRS